ncbi:MFS transporter [Afifella sp. IM 167]|nr:MFS transporter [Afifella sp. IM 167]
MGQPVLVDDRTAKRNVIVLATAQAIAGAGGPINFSISSLAAHMLLGSDKSLSTLPLTAFVVGTAIGTVPAALLQRTFGRRLGLIAGMLVGAGGALLEATAMAFASFPLLCLGAFLMGFTAAFVQQFRFAAADTASPTFRPKAISLVLIGGIFAAIIGPQTVIHTKNAWPLVPFAAPYLAAAGLMILAALVLTTLHAPRPAAGHRRHGGRPLTAILVQPRFLVAVACAIISYALMNLMMTAAPLAMVWCGLPEEAAFLGIQWHVIAMFAPSFFTGTLIARYGSERVVAAGLILLLVCAAIALTGIDLLHFWGALVVLGIGWNLGFLGATALVATTYEPEERERVQGFNDLLVFGAVAVASFSSGRILVAGGWSAVAWTVIPIAALPLVGLLILLAVQKRRAVRS